MSEPIKTVQNNNYLGVFGHVNIDLILELPKLPEPNTSTEVDTKRMYYGGTGANIARWAAKLGVRTSLASFVGRDFPEHFRKALADEGLDLTDLSKMEEYTTPTCWIMTDPEQNQVAFMDQGPMKVMGEFPVARHARHTIDSCELIHIGTGRPEYYENVMLAAKEKGKRIFFDPAQEIHYVYDPASFRKLLDMSDVFFANQNEMATALKYMGLGSKEELLHHVDMMILTQGKEGSQIITSDVIHNIPAVAPKAMVDPTGAGDAFRAGFYAGMNRGLPIEQCGNLGAITASFALENKGPQENIPTWEDVLARGKNNNNIEINI